ncbi:hypothetical protein GCM10022247_37230 [Allokutzneria multivorans]|uniref:Uncharacterized protein n=2 Tax=Allokutzneria multivorans TaxID=1142134 RepID=A0ABP7SGH2_9PSEU
MALRECVKCFQPYGFRATWHHVIVSANVPRLLEDDLDSLVRAVDELEQARAVWRSKSEEHAALRRREKASGRRVPRRADPWHAWAGLVAYCPDFEKHPTERLDVVLRRVISAFESGVDLTAQCRACARALTEDAPCPDCGVDPVGPTAVRRVGTVHRWREVWLRSGS